MPRKGQKIGFLGAGMMAEALISGLLKAGLVTPAGLLACDINTGRLEHLKEKYLIETTVDHEALIKQADLVIPCRQTTGRRTAVKETAQAWSAGQLPDLNCSGYYHRNNRVMPEKSRYRW